MHSLSAGDSLRSLIEEALLAARFGAEYAQYKPRTWPLLPPYGLLDCLWRLSYHQDMRTLILDKKMPAEELAVLAAEGYGDFVKAVADISRGVIALGGEMHADAEALLLEAGSAQEDLWGFNLLMGMPPGQRIEYTSLINIRPKQGNPSTTVSDGSVRSQIDQLVGRFIEFPQ